MNNFFQKSLTVVAILATVAVASAQGGGQPGQGGQGRGQGRGGFGGGFGQRGGFGGQNELSLALRKDVQADLGVNADQVAKLTALQEKQRQARGQGFGGGQGQGGQGQGQGRGQGRGQGGGQMTDEQRAAFQKQMEEQRAQQRKDLAAILNEGQMKRLDEIALQLQGNRALTQKATQEKLGFTQEQKDKVQALQDKSREAMTSLMEKMRNQELTREEAQSTMTKNNQILNDELAKVLTPAQAGKFKEMQGKPFKADPNEAQGRRGGGGGGGS